MKRLVMTVSLLLATMSVCAENAASQLVKYMQFSTFTANFVQRTLDGNQVVQRSNGKVWIKRPGYFRWQVQSPQSSLLIVNPTTVWNYDEDLAQATKQPLNKAQGLNAANFLSGDTDSLVKQFAISAQQKGQAITFTLLPKQKTFFESMQLTFTGKILTQMDTQNAIGQHSVFVFSQIKYNQSLSAKLFKFVPPKGVDVLDNG